MKKIYYFLFFIIIAIMIGMYHNKVKKTGKHEENYFVFQVLDENGKILESETLKESENKKHTIRFYNTNKKVKYEKLFVILNGQTYNLNLKDENKSLIVENKDTQNIDIEFKNLKNGKYLGLFIVEHINDEPSSLFENYFFSRFVLEKNSGDLNIEDIKNSKSNLSVQESSEHIIKDEVNKIIDFAVFNEEQLNNKNFKIKLFNDTKNGYEKDIPHYAYIYNWTKAPADYSIILVSEDDAISSNPLIDKITVPAKSEAVFKIQVPNDFISDNESYYFVLVPYPLRDPENEKIENGIKLHFFPTNSQKFIKVP